MSIYFGIGGKALAHICSLYPLGIWLIGAFIAECSNLCSIANALETNFCKAWPAYTSVILPDGISYDRASALAGWLTSHTSVKATLRTCTSINWIPYFGTGAINTTLPIANLANSTNTSQICSIPYVTILARYIRHTLALFIVIGSTWTNSTSNSTRIACPGRRWGTLLRKYLA